MITDMNMSVGHWPFRKLQVTSVAGLVALMDNHAIDRALVANLEGVLYKDVMAANEGLAAQVHGNEERIIPQAAINPAFPGWRRDLQRCVDVLGFGSVRLYPSYHGYALSDDCCDALMEAADALSLLVSVSVRMTDERMHHWRVMVPPTDITALPAIAAAHPGAEVVINCANNGELWPIAEGIRACRNLCVEISHTEGPGGVCELAEQIGSERVLYGSHAPYFCVDNPRLKLEEAGITGEMRRLLEGINAERILRV